MRTSLTELSDELDQQPEKEGRSERGNNGPQEREDHRRETGELSPLYRMLVEIPRYWNADRTHRTDRQQQKNQRKKETKTTSDWRKGDRRRRGLGQLHYLLVEVQPCSLAYRTYGTVQQTISKKKKTPATRGRRKRGLGPPIHLLVEAQPGLQVDRAYVTVRVQQTTKKEPLATGRERTAEGRLGGEDLVRLTGC